jgi:hypothetical protein
VRSGSSLPASAGLTCQDSAKGKDQIGTDVQKDQAGHGDGPTMVGDR